MTMSWVWRLSCRTTSSSRCFPPSCFCSHSPVFFLSPISPTTWVARSARSCRRRCSTDPGADATAGQQRERRAAHVRRRRCALEQFRGAGLDRRRAEPRVRHRGGTTVVEGPPRRHRSDARRGADRLGRVVAGTRRPDARREAGTDDGVGCTLRVDVAGPAVAAGVRARRDRNRAHLLLRPGCRAGLGVDHARCRRRHDALAAGLPPVQGLRRQLHRLRRLVRRGRRRHRPDALVLRLRHRHPDRCGAERRDRTCLPVRQSPGSEERARQAPHRRSGGASVSRAAALRRTGSLSSRLHDPAATAEARVRCGGRGCDFDDEVVESAWRFR